MILSLQFINHVDSIHQMYSGFVQRRMCDVRPSTLPRAKNPSTPRITISTSGSWGLFPTALQVSQAAGHDLDRHLFLVKQSKPPPGAPVIPSFGRYILSMYLELTQDIRFAWTDEKPG